MITPAELYKAQESVLEINREINQFTENADKHIHKVKWEYQDKIREIERKKYDHLNELEKEKNSKVSILEAERKKHRDIVDQAIKVFKFINIYIGDIFLYLTPDEDLPLYIDDDTYDQEEIKRRLRNEKRHLEFNNPHYNSLIYNRTGIEGLEKEGLFKEMGPCHYESLPFKILADDDYKKIALYITVNKKPVNCFDLEVRKNTIFNLDDSYYTDKEIVLYSGPTIKAVKSWYEKKEQKIREEHLDIYKGIEAGYHEAIELFKKPDWRMAYMLYKKDYYENYYSGGTYTPQYKKILNEIERLKGISVC